MLLHEGASLGRRDLPVLRPVALVACKRTAKHESTSVPWLGIWRGRSHAVHVVLKIVFDLAWLKIATVVFKNTTATKTGSVSLCVLNLSTSSIALGNGNVMCDNSIAFGKSNVMCDISRPRLKNAS